MIVLAYYAADHALFRRRCVVHYVDRRQQPQTRTVLESPQFEIIEPNLGLRRRSSQMPTDAEMFANFQVQKTKLNLRLNEARGQVIELTFNQGFMGKFLPTVFGSLPLREARSRVRDIQREISVVDDAINKIAAAAKKRSVDSKHTKLN